MISVSRLIYYDFGMMDELSEEFRRALVNGFFALYENDAPRIVDALIEGGLLGGKVDRLSVDSIARYFLANFEERLALDRALPMTRADREKLRMATMQQAKKPLTPDSLAPLVTPPRYVLPLLWVCGWVCHRDLFSLSLFPIWRHLFSNLAGRLATSSLRSRATSPSATRRRSPSCCAPSTLSRVSARASTPTMT